MNFNKVCKTVEKFVKRNSPTILTAIGSVGVIVTAVLAAKGAPKAEQAKKEVIYDKGEDLTLKETIITCGPSYTPAVLVGAATIACFAGAAYISNRQKAMLVSAVEMMRGAYVDYRNKVIDIGGEESDRQVVDALHRDNPNDPLFNGDHPDEKITFYDLFSGRTFEAYEKEIIDAEYQINRHFCETGEISLNEYLAAFGLPGVKDGDKKGWHVTDGYFWLDFGHRIIKGADDMDVYEIYTYFPPEEDYLSDWIA